MKSSVVIFSYNNPFGLKKCINSLLKQTLSADEIIIIDNSKQINNEYNNLDRVRYFYNGFENSKLSFAVARNLGLSIASGDFIILAEDDAYYSSLFIQSIINQFKKGADVVCYRILPNPEFKNPNWIKLGEHFRIDYDFGLIDLGESEVEISSDLIFNSFAFKKCHYEKSNGWGADGLLDEYSFYNSGGEITLLKNLIEVGAKVFLYSPKALMFHDKRETRLNNDYFFNRYAYWGAEDAYHFINNNSIKISFLYNILKNLIKIVLMIKSVKLTNFSYEDRNLLLLIRRFAYFSMIFHFIIFKKLIFIKENYNRNWRLFDYSSLKKVKQLWFLNYKIYLNEKNNI
jgi:glycosyltransferase involved in cell wall biosynthesis